MSPEDDFSSLETEGEAEYVACTAWEHDTTFWKMTIIMDFDLVCDVSLYELAKMNHQSDALILLSPLRIRKVGAIAMVAFLMSHCSTHSTKLSHFSHITSSNIKICKIFPSFSFQYAASSIVIVCFEFCFSLYFSYIVFFWPE